MIHTINLLISSLLNHPIKRFVFAIVFGLLLSLSLPFFGFWFFAWLALVPLFLLIKSAASYRSALIEAFLFLFSYSLIAFSWTTGLHPLTWHGYSNLESILITGLAWLIPSLFHTLLLIPFVLLTKLIYELRGTHRAYELGFFETALISFIWLVLAHKIPLNLGENLGAFSVPINLLAYSQYKNTYFIQAANVIGAIGIEFLIVFFNLSISNLFNIQKISENYSTSRFNIKQPYFGIENAARQVQIFIVIALFLFSSFTYSLFEIQNEKSELIKRAKDLKSFALVQADYSAAASRGSNPNPDNLVLLQSQISSKISKQAGAKPVDILAWSEGAVPALNTEKYQSEFFDKLESSADLFAFGTFTEQSGKVYNAIEFHELSYGTKQFYLKNKLVPFGEYVPFLGMLPKFLKNIAQSTVGDGFSAANSRDPIISQEFKISANICFELLFPKLVREGVLNRGELIVNVNDLSWFNGFLNGKVLKKQFLAAAVFRAVENKRDLLLAGNSGYSALITSTGKIINSSKASKIEMVQGSFLPRSNLSLYTLYGW